ncbi:MAG: hypothetical protein WKF77_06970 [Planctomycetaceae bacterium]
MNRRKLLAAGIGLGTLALTSKSSQAGCDDEEWKAEFTGPVYCPIYPYMFCGSYTLYYAVQKVGTVCNANPASLAGPNGLPCGCQSTSCVATFKREEAKATSAVVGDPTHAHKALGKLGMKKRPNKKLTFASGANTVGGGAGGDPSYVVSFKDADMQDRVARVYQVDITASQIDKEMLTELGIDPSVIIDKTFYVGHEDIKASGDVLDDPAARGVRDQKHTYRVTATIEGNTTEFLVVMKRP